MSLVCGGGGVVVDVVDEDDDNEDDDDNVDDHYCSVNRKCFCIVSVLYKLIHEEFPTYFFLPAFLPSTSCLSSSCPPVPG
jgi:hypothetical protein